MDKLRARFEEWAKENNYMLHTECMGTDDDGKLMFNDIYGSNYTQVAWEAWKGCYNALLEPDEGMIMAGLNAQTNAIPAAHSTHYHAITEIHKAMLKQWGEGDEQRPFTQQNF